MKVELHPADHGGCSFYRILCPAAIAESEGVETNVTLDVARGIGMGDPSKLIVGPTPADVIIFQRPAKNWIPQAIQEYQRRGHTVVVDIDDDFSCLPTGHPARDKFNPNLSPEVNWQHLAKCARYADLVTVPTPALAERYGAHGRVAVLPNCVPAALLDIPNERLGETVGYGGSLPFHIGDLPETRGGVAEALRRTGWRFHMVGGAEDAQKQLSLDEPPSETGYLELDQWFEALGTLDVGIVPLADTAFNNAKSYLKGIEYAARGVPFVASPTAEYTALSEEGIGLLAAGRARNWRSQLVKLIEDEHLREEMIALGRERVAEHHTYESEGWRWAEAWEDAMSNRNRKDTSAQSAA